MIYYLLLLRYFFKINKEIIDNLNKRKNILNSDYFNKNKFNHFIKFNIEYKKLPFTSYYDNKKIIIDINNYDFLQIWGQIQIDNSKNTFNIIFDTGSNLLWVPSYYCKKCPKNSKRFKCDTENCKFFSNEIELSYASGSIKGNILKDYIYFKDKNNTFQIKDFLFVLVSDSKGLNDLFADGVFGLGFEDELNRATFIDKLLYNNQITKPYVSFLFSKYQEYYGQMIIGDLNKEAIGNQNIEWSNVIDNDYWAISLNKIIFGNDKIYDNINLPFLIDTGTSFNLFPSNIFNNITKILNNKGIKCKISSDLLFCTDNNINIKLDIIYPNMIFYINKKEFILNPIDYIAECEIKKKYRNCLLKISRFDYYVAIIGLPFIKKFYTIFDYKNKKIGFVNNKLYDYVIIIENKLSNIYIIIIIILLLCYFYFKVNKLKNKKYKLFN